jgi:hypothetical protein
MEKVTCAVVSILSLARKRDRKVLDKPKHWRAFQAENAWNTAPNGVIHDRELLITPRSC